MEEFAAVFADLEDPRTGNAKRHELLEILLIGLCTVLCGGETCTDMVRFGRAKHTFLEEVLTLRYGIPSHDTFSRVFRLLDPAQFQACFQMLWGGGDGMARSPPEATDGAPHATAERLEPVPHRSEPGRHLNRDHRDEPIEVARRRHRPRDRAPPAEEACG